MDTKQPAAGRKLQNEIHPICRKLTFELMPEKFPTEDRATSDAQSSSPKLTTDVPLCDDTKIVGVGRNEGNDKGNGSASKKKLDFVTPKGRGNKNYQSKVNIYLYHRVSRLYK